MSKNIVLDIYVGHLSVHSGFAVTTSEVSVGTVEDEDILLESFQANLNK